MKKCTHLKLILPLFFLCIISFNSFGQSTMYDQLPGIDPINKPSLSLDFPEWGKLLYQNNVNFKEIEKLFNADNSRYKEKSALHRYYKIWKKGVVDFVQRDGSIVIPESSYLQFNNNTVTSGPPMQSKAATWEFLGPVETFFLNETGSPTTPLAASWQVNVYSFDVSVSNPSVLYAATETGFVNKSTDNGLSWEIVGQQYLFGSSLTSVSIHPSDEDIVFVGSRGAIHKSIDGGLSWTSVPTTANHSTTKIIINPITPQEMVSSGSEGVFVSIDGGGSWTQSYSNITWDVEYRPDNPLIVYGISKTGSNFNLIESTDGGNNFTSISNFPSYVESEGGLLAVCAASPDILYVGLLGANDTPYLIHGTDSGTSWSFQTVATGLTTQFSIDNWQGFYDFGMDVNPLNEDEILIGTASLYKSTDGGTNFTAIGGYQGSFSVHPDLQGVKYVDGNNVWISTDGGMNYSTDAFTSQANFTARNNGLIGSDMWGFDQGWNEDIIVGGKIPQRKHGNHRLLWPKST